MIKECIKCISSGTAWKGLCRAAAGGSEPQSLQASCAVRERVLGVGIIRKCKVILDSSSQRLLGVRDQLSQIYCLVLIGCFGEIQVGEVREDDSGRAEG